jgi:hypothetical protein
MEKWKRAFDEYTQIPKCKHLPSALFINHVADLDGKHGGIIEAGVNVSKELETLC